GEWRDQEQRHRPRQRRGGVEIETGRPGARCRSGRRRENLAQAGDEGQREPSRPAMPRPRATSATAAMASSTANSWPKAMEPPAAAPKVPPLKVACAKSPRKAAYARIASNPAAPKAPACRHTEPATLSSER